MMTWLATFSASFLGAFFGVWCVQRKVRFHIKPLSMTYETRFGKPDGSPPGARAWNDPARDPFGEY